MVKECKKISERLKSGLSKLRYSPSITVDIWTDAGMLHSYLGFISAIIIFRITYLGTTIHFIYDKNGSLSLGNAFLGLNLLEIKTGSTIKKAVEEKLGEYGILLSDLSKTVKDGGTNIIAAFDTPYMSINMILKIEVKF